MGGPKPCLGYPSRTAAVIGMRAEGLDTKQISDAIGIDRKTVIALEVGSSRPKRMPIPGTDMGRAVLFPTDVLDALGPAAARRNISVNHLARLIVSTVVDEKMIDAVLDDADDLNWSFAA